MSNLRTRAGQTGRQDVATRPGPESLPSLIERMQGAFERAAPRGVEAVQLVRDAQTCLRTIPNLDRCEPATVLGALMTAAQLGLRPGVLGQCWPLPFYDGKSRTYKAQFVLGYQGMIELAYRSPLTRSIVGRTVYENDLEWDVQLGTEDRIVHRPLLDGPRGKAIAYYAVLKTANDGHIFFWMSHADACRHRDLYAPKNREGRIVGPWAKPEDSPEFEAMAVKTTVRYLHKWVAKSTALATAIEVDGTVRVDASPDVPAIEASQHPEPAEAGGPVEGIVEPSEYDPTNDPGFGEQ